MTSPKNVYVGIDVSTAHLDMAVLPGAEELRFTNDLEGIKALTDRLGE